jgi:two-component system LytT family response regulator
MIYKFENVRAIQKADISPQDIILIKADFNYTIFHLVNGKKLILAKTLLECQQMLEAFDFVRPNRSVIINLHAVKGIGENGIKLKNNTLISVSRRRANSITVHINRVLDLL